MKLLHSAATVVLLAAQLAAQTDRRPGWLPRDAARYLDTLQLETRSTSAVGDGTHGAVAVSYGPFAARAGLAVLERGGNAIDAALTTAVTQVAVTAGAPISYFGILSLVYYDAKTGAVSTMNAGWNTIRGDADPLTIPGKIDLGPNVLGTAVSGRTALVGGFMKGVEAAHRKFGRLPWKTLFEPAIWVAERGMPVSETLAHQFEIRAADLGRLPATRAILLKADGSPYRAGDWFRQPALATTLRALAKDGAGYLYGGPWGDRLVAAVAADGGRMTKEDLLEYQPIWAPALRASVGEVEIVSLPLPNEGGVALIEAQQLARAAEIGRHGHWSTSAEAFRQIAAIGAAGMIGYLPEAVRAQRFPNLSLDPERRLGESHARDFWSHLAKGDLPIPFASPPPKHSDDVVVIDAQGNMAAITHSINCVFWGKTAINIDGISIGDPGSYQQALIAKTGPGRRLPDPTEQGLVFRAGRPILAFASMGSGLHQRTLQGLANVLWFGMTVDQAIDAPDLFLPSFDGAGGLTQPVPADRFPTAVLEGAGIRVAQITKEQMRLAGEGVWVAISKDPKTGMLRAGSNNRNNSIALAY